MQIERQQDMLVESVNAISQIIGSQRSIPNGAARP
jgi:hypothetical protein